MPPTIPLPQSRTSHLHEETRGVYYGYLLPHLHGRKATLRPCSDRDKVLAQFDDIDTGFAYAWYEFHRAGFEVKEC